MHDVDSNVIIAGASSGISTTLNGNIAGGATSLTLTSATNFPSSGTVHLKIDNEIKSGTISGTSVTSLTNVEGTDVAQHNGCYS